MNRRESVLVLGDAEDSHTVAVARFLNRARVEVLLRDVWTPWEPSTLAAGNGSSHGLSPPDSQGSFRGVWVRLKPRLGDLNESESFALRERREFLFSLVVSSSPPNVINDPYMQDRARNKPLQLAAAEQVGLVVPATWVTNDALFLANRALERGNQIVYKPLTWLATASGGILFTNVVSSQELVAHSRALAQVPGIYQEVVPKRCEYRITIVDDEIFCVRIFSQERLETKIDWRRNQGDLRYERCDMDDLTTSRLRELVLGLRLRYAAIDLIETPVGELVFLEANPAGNWLWLEERLNLPISKAIAAALLR